MKLTKRILVKIGVSILLLIATLLLIIVIWAYAGGYLPNYDEEWIVGKTQKQIERRYGKFDEFHELSTDNGEIYYLAIYYQTRTKPEPGPFAGISYGRNFHITFNEGGIATSARSVSLDPG
ncbi:MAG: hypothetical protein E7633_06365 [Ruminococcaceae bacterium]|nr:hypothetical protein [Oscillospiraceae bacterium]